MGLQTHMGWGHGSSWVQVWVGNSNPQKTHTCDMGLTGIAGVASWCDRVTPLLTILIQRNTPSKTQLQQDKNTKELRTTRNMKGQCRHNKRAGVQGVPQIVIFLFGILLMTTQDSDHNIRQEGTLLLAVLFPFQCGERRGTSLHVMSSQFDAARRAWPFLVMSLSQRCGEEGLPLPIMTFPFQHDEVRHAPPCHVFIPVLIQQEGFAPSPSCHFHFNTLRKVMSLPIVSFFQFRSSEGGHAPPCCVIVILMHQGGLCPSPSHHPSRSLLCPHIPGGIQMESILIPYGFYGFHMENFWLRAQPFWSFFPCSFHMKGSWNLDIPWNIPLESRWNLS